MIQGVPGIAPVAAKVDRPAFAEDRPTSAYDRQVALANMVPVPDALSHVPFCGMVAAQAVDAFHVSSPMVLDAIPKLAPRSDS